MSSKSKSQQQQSSNQQDNRIVADNGAIAVAGSSGVNVNLSDMGLIERAFTYLTDRDELAFEQQNAILQKVGTGFDRVLESGMLLTEKSATGFDKIIETSKVTMAQAATAADPTAQQTRFEYLIFAAVTLALLLPMFKGK